MATRNVAGQPGSPAGPVDRAWGRWGSDDERGALNLVTPEVVVAATRLVRTGRVYPLGLPVARCGVPNFDYRGIPQRLTLMTEADQPRMAANIGAPPGLGANEDVLIVPSHTSTHMDALCHVYSDGVHYNGFPASGMTPYEGAARCGIDKVGGVVTRGVLLDVVGLRGVRWLEAGEAVTAADLQGCLDRQAVALRPGDAVLVRTGWLEWFGELGESRFAQPGLGLDAALFLAGHDPAIVGADNSAVEVMPFDAGRVLPVHVELLVHRGIHLVEHVRLDELAADGCSEFLFTVAPLPVTGATASPVNPLAVG